MTDGLSFRSRTPQGLIVMEVGKGRSLGVDVEKFLPDISINLADHFFCPARAGSGSSS